MANISQMTTEERLEKVEMELARAKRRNRLLLAVVLLAFVLLAVGATTPATRGSIGGRENIIRANRFILEDENGKTRADLGLGKEGPGLLLYDENGKNRALLGVDKDGTMLGLSDENGKPRAGLAVIKDRPMLGLSDENGKSRAALGSSKTTSPDGKVITYPESSLFLYKPDGKVLWQAPP